jgi:hypothetical protein
LDTPRQEVLVRKSSRPPTSSLGTLTSMVLDLHNTGTVRKRAPVRKGNLHWEEGKEGFRGT